ncbi:AsnC family transcriptional regulator [Conexibacter sp. W3-3-2]|uniref:Lrp/AsnC family transcriptional regulator n=1 Tax=Conexibacter sp. W3-3-2 TaxID=2675227 RepID=UPI0012B8FA41|nr:Lrp/AsnC family transcriptional regulator [Conexibacter sp. W3-3-2]MTD45784.1 AsnC family transcriptional regulator [Conexibacter sp. W3-3-2]
MALDETDLEIIDLLERDGRASYAEIGRAVSLSTAAAKRRVDRLEADGVITGFRAQVDHRKLGWTLEAFIELRFAGTTGITGVHERVASMREVRAVYAIAGDPDAIVHLRARDMEHIQQVIERLRGSGRVTGTKTLMVLGAWQRVGTGRPTP